jgi:hypothetical protein
VNLFKRYIFWTYERGSFHYDVMVTLILLFIFISPHVIDFGDRPVQEDHVHGHDILVQASAGGVLVYQVSAKELKKVGAASANGSSLQQQLTSSIQPIAGTVVLDRYETLKDANGKVEAYKVFAHRPADARVQ